MQFSALVLSMAIGAAIGPNVISAFAPSCSVRSVASLPAAAVGGQRHGLGCACAACMGHGLACSCAACLRVRHGLACTCAACLQLHSVTCLCAACFRTKATMLFMSSDADPELVEEEISTAATSRPPHVPPIVEALDGIASEEEAHNAERPVRSSGIHKHQKKAAAAIRTPLSDLVIGSMVEGRVKTVTSYGAFLDVGAETDALLHISRLSDEFVSNVSDIVKQGDVVHVRILQVNTEKKQIAVSMRSEEAESASQQQQQQQESGGGGERRKARPQRSGGDRNAQRALLTKLAEAGVDEDKFVEGEVVSTLDFGAFVRFDTSQLLEDVRGELDGLVHISSLSAGRASSVVSIVRVGDRVKVRVKQLDVEGNKVSLSMISKEEEQAPRGGSRGDDRPKRKGRAMFSESEMGAKDWKESMEKMKGDMPEFTNTAVIVTNTRK